MASPKVQVEIAANVQKFGAGIQSAMRMLSGFIGAAALAGMARSAIDLGSHITDLSAKAGVAAEWLQEVGYAAKMAGSNIDDVANAVLELRRAQVDALKGNAGDGQAFAALGITLAELRQLGPEQLFDRIADAVQRTGGSAVATAAALQVLGRGGRQLIGGLVEGFGESRKRAQELGLIIRDDTLNALDEMGDALDTLKTKFAAVSAEVISQVTALKYWIAIKDVVLSGAKLTTPAWHLANLAKRGLHGATLDAVMEFAAARGNLDSISTSGSASNADQIAKERLRKKNDRAAFSEIGPDSNSKVKVQADSLARIGGYVGGGNASGQSLLRVQTEALIVLRSVNRHLETVARKGSTTGVSW